MFLKDRYSVKTRFLTTFATNIVRLGIGFVTGLLIARSLGPANYGNFSFLIGSFGALAALVDTGTSSAFYTFISRKARGTRFFALYGTWILLQFLILLALVGWLPEKAKDRLWLGQPKELIFLALCTTFAMNQLWRLLGQVGESIRDTVGVQMRNLLVAVGYMFCVLAAGFADLLTIKSLLLINVGLYLFFSILYAIRLHRQGVFRQNEPLAFWEILKEFKDYCSPLLLYTWVGFFYTFADLWLLQRFGGATQQGYYAIGARIAAVTLIATTSILQVFWKEISDAHEKRDTERIKNLYFVVSRRLYFISALISCALIPFSREILSLVLGPAYAAAWLPLSIMLLYPIHQSMGQITGTVLYSMGKTRAKSYTGLVFMAVSLVCSYFFIAPHGNALPGLGLGAAGLSAKMVLCQWLDVNLMAFFVARYTASAFDWMHQFKVIVPLLIFGFAWKLGAQMVFTSLYMTALTSLMGYALSIVLLLYWQPALAGTRQEDLKTMIARIAGSLRKREFHYSANR
jgi:O-antigen/teichoic acid export membrane protein